METMKVENLDHWFLGVLFLILMTLKLTHVIDWSWLWVTAPLWIPFALLAAFVVGLISVLIVKLLIEIYKFKWSG